tara:strand:- start:75 stop:389 length:315 start_codon:yes stop_codon:yes gene_type:complete
MATSFKQKAVAELRAAKKIQREQEVTAQAQYEENRAAKHMANEERIANKMARILNSSTTQEPVVEEISEVEAVEEAIVEKPKPKAKAKPKITVKKKGRPAKSKK